MKKIPASTLSVLVSTSVILIVAVCVDAWTRYTAQARNPPTQQSTQVRINLPEYAFINPLLFSDNAKSVTAYSTKLASLISSYISAAENATTSIKSVSVYFRDLNTAQWTGVNEDIQYRPSSMLKVLAMMAALKVAEADPAILSESLQFHKVLAGGIYYEGDGEMVDGHYTLAELIDSMVIHSDNDAFLSIVADKRINDEFEKTYNLFHLPPAGLMANAPDFMSPKSYATLFRILYNSTFFPWRISEQTLKLLSKTTFDKGLVAGVPPGVTVAHKFGENTDQLHDCGIIYYPKSPYLLCVMTKGTDLSALESTIAGISKIVYGFVSTTDHSAILTP